VLFAILSILGVLAPFVVRLVLGLVALHRCEVRDVPEVAKVALTFDKKITVDLGKRRK
jgi:hypothetical protein